jgi:hypothetical protein
VSNEALCVITGIITINIKIEERAKYYECIKGNGNLINREMEINHSTHPAYCVKIIEGQEDSKRTIKVNTDGSKSKYGVGSGVAIFTASNLTDTTQCRCSNNQAEQLTILKALENVQNLENTERTVLVSTDSWITLESRKNRRTTHTSLKKS